jgi:hypothetical protein
MNEILMGTILDCVLFLQLSDDIQVDPDAAVKQTEQIAWRLKQLTSEEQVQFVRYVLVLASQVERETGRDRHWHCLKDMPEALGLTGPSET